MDITLTKEESEAFDFVLGEIKCLVNEYDSSTGRKPSKKRYKKYSVLTALVDRWAKFQNKVVTAKGLELILYPVKPCCIPVSDKEAKAVVPLFEDYIQEAQKYPHLCKDKEAAESVLEKLKLCDG